MEVIAKTNTGFLLNATERELKEILSAVNGVKPNGIEIGQKVPAIDYASTITKLKGLRDSYEFNQLIKYSKELNSSIDEIKQKVIDIENIQL